MFRELGCFAVVGALLIPAQSAMAQFHGDPFGPPRDGHGRRPDRQSIETVVMTENTTGL